MVVESVNQILSGNIKQNLLPSLQPFKLKIKKFALLP